MSAAAADPGPAGAEGAIREDRLIAIVRAPTAEVARSCAEAARAGGIRCIEITFGVPGCVDLIGDLASAWPDVVMGAGTVITPDDARAAARAGARFAVSPNVDAAVVRAARDAGMVSVPGAATPTEIVAAVHAGATLVKVFPSKTLGGPEYIRLVRGPLPDVPLVSTGGIALASVAAYLEAGVVAVGATSDLFIPDLVESADWDRVARRARSWRDAARGAPRG